MSHTAHIFIRPAVSERRDQVLPGQGDAAERLLRAGVGCVALHLHELALRGVEEVLDKNAVAAGVDVVPVRGELEQLRHHFHPAAGEAGNVGEAEQPATAAAATAAAGLVDCKDRDAVVPALNSAMLLCPC